MTFNIDAIFLVFGGRTALHQRLNTKKHPITIRALDKWRERGTIPSAWLARITKLADADGIPFLLHTFLIREPHPAEHSAATHSLLE